MEGDNPANAKIFNEIAAVGYAVPQIIARSAQVSTNLQPTMDALIKSGVDAKEFASKMASFINKGA